VIDGVL
jgi:hypothetical protein